MKDEFLNLNLYKNMQGNRFELTVDGYTAFIDFQEEGKVIKLIHTESPEELAGRGVAMALVEKTLLYIEQNQYELIPLCPLVYSFIKKNSDWKRVVSKEFSGYDNL
ncbi:N-acetyltransferase [Myroides albus]|uniref:N-acetyltransferase n=1 Tax=Myroides albus TaxID=2562892 RepID=A0A6I3LP31_9FLAO|nr:GNAT family N-acetyltransferase [Myroides albus]MTG97735.1 N-acetyltransferase [Myroides albus]UVD78716.1 N-acetyltransferase [Myroides albus]